MDLTNEQIKDILKRIEMRLGAMQKRKYEFYYECGLSSALYSNWNTGKAKPSAPMLGKIAEYLNVSYEWLISGEEDKKITATDSDGNDYLNKRIEYVKSLFSQMSEENQIQAISDLQSRLLNQLALDVPKESD